MNFGLSAASHLLQIDLKVADLTNRLPDALAKHFIETRNHYGVVTAQYPGSRLTRMLDCKLQVDRHRVVSLSDGHALQGTVFPGRKDVTAAIGAAP